MSSRSGLVGHEKQREQLSKLAQKDSLPHALLFCGPEGIGKYRFALTFAASLLSNNGQDEGMLRLCKSGNHPDLHILNVEEGKKDIAVDDVRALISAMHLKPYYAKATVAIINDAHRMNSASSNALLMTLEEPNPESYLILVTHAPNRLLPTIISRCQITAFNELNEAQIEEILSSSQCSAEFDSQKLSALCRLTQTSLAPLGLAGFTNPRTGEISDTNGASKHLEKLNNDYKIIAKTVHRFFENYSSEHEALSLASAFAEEKERTPLMWHILKQETHKKMLASAGQETMHWANLLEAILSAEQLVNERNANIQLQISSALLR